MTSVEPSIDELVRPLTRSWWAWALFAALSFVIGIIALVGGDLGLVTLASLFGGYLLVAGCFDAIGGLSDEQDNPSRRIFAVVLGVLAMIAGLICLRHPDGSLFVLVLVTGIYLMVAGGLHLASGFDYRGSGVERALGIVYVVVGSLIFALPALRLGTLAALFGVAILARGAAALAEARRLRSALPARPDRARAHTLPG
jgi:uncharacterized membrane protein HdeD (DUF308 family)